MLLTSELPVFNIYEGLGGAAFMKRMSKVERMNILHDRFRGRSRVDVLAKNKEHIYYGFLTVGELEEFFVVIANPWSLHPDVLEVAVGKAMRHESEKLRSTECYGFYFRTSGELFSITRKIGLDGDSLPEKVYCPKEAKGLLKFRAFEDLADFCLRDLAEGKEYTPSEKQKKRYVDLPHSFFNNQSRPGR